MEETPLLRTFFEASLSDDVYVGNALSLEQANAIFHFFQNHWLFLWGDAHNDCEDRANAISILLDAWQIPNYKGWVFSGAFLKQEDGTLNNAWNYHVASILPVSINNLIDFYVIDPATLSQAATISFWANNVTETPNSYYLIKNNWFYIFSAEGIQRDNWHMRDEENYTWTMEGLAGLNGVSPEGDAIIRNNPRLIGKTKREFNKLKNGDSPFKGLI